MSADRPSRDSERASGSLQVGPRAVPPPDGASEALREAVAASADAMGEPLQVPKDEAAWLALIEADTERKLAALEPMIAASPVSVEQLTLRDVAAWRQVALPARWRPVQMALGAVAG